MRVVEDEDEVMEDHDDFKLLEQRGIEGLQECALCNKWDDVNMVGPFVSSKARQMEYWFHQNCLIRNEYVVKVD